MQLDTTYSPSILTFGPLNPPQNRNHSHNHMHAGLVVCQNGLNDYASLLCKPILTRKSIHCDMNSFKSKPIMWSILNQLGEGGGGFLF